MHHLFFIKSPCFISPTSSQRISCARFFLVFQDLIDFPDWHFMTPWKKKLFFKTDFLMWEKAKD